MKANVAPFLIERQAIFKDWPKRQVMAVARQMHRYAGGAEHWAAKMDILLI